MSTLRVALLVGVSMFATTAWAGEAFAAPASGQSSTPRPQDPQQADPGESQVDDIVVTAQRREERVQDIPLAISAFTGQQLAKAGVVSLETIAPRVPSFYFGSFGATRPQLYLRGIGTRSFDPGSESSVGVFTDEVYLGRASGSFGSLKDVNRIEVLRGPQGTLYGRNTIGGAINVITNGPTPEYQATVEAGVSNYSGWDLFGAVGGPITADKTVMFRVAGWHAEREGYVTNLTTGNKFQGVDNTGFRGRLAFQPTETFRVDLTAEYIEDGDAAGFGGINQGTGRTAAGAAADPRAVFFAAASRLPNQRLPVSLRAGYLNYDPTLDRSATSYIGRVEYDADFATLTSVTSYRELEATDTRDLDGSSLDTLSQTGIEESKQFTQEFRLTSNPEGPMSFGGAFDWIVGAFYYKDESSRQDLFRVGEDSAVRAALNTPAFDNVFTDYESSSYAIFGQATAHFGEQFDVTVGARYTEDKKDVRFQDTTTDASPIIAAAFTTTQAATYDSFDPRVVATYKFTPDINVYASYSTGFKSGGFQYAPFNLAAANTVFNPEDITTYEVGFKSEFADRRIRFNAAAFTYDYKDLQISRIIDTASGPQTLISNAASSTINGLDLELLLRPSDNLDFSFTYGYLDATYDNYVFNIAQNLVFSGTTLVRAPSNSLNAGIEYRIPIASNQLTLRADAAFTDTFYHEPGEGNPVFGSGIPLTVEKSYTLVDLKAVYEVGDLRFTAYVNNVADEEYRRTVNALGATVVGFAGAPRLYGFRVSYSY